MVDFRTFKAVKKSEYYRLVQTVAYCMATPKDSFKLQQIYTTKMNTKKRTSVVIYAVRASYNLFDSPTCPAFHTGSADGYARNFYKQ